MQKPAAACRSPTTSRQALEKIKLRQLQLQQNELFEEGTRQVIEARRSRSAMPATLHVVAQAFQGFRRKEESLWLRANPVILCRQ